MKDALVSDDKRQKMDSGYRRFGISTLLLAVLCLAIGLAGYKIGFERGQRLGSVVPARLSGSIYVQQYDVSDLGVPLDQLVREVRSSVVIDSWDVVGGYATIRLDEESESLVVEQDLEGHAMVYKYLSEFRLYFAEHGSRATAEGFYELRKPAKRVTQ